MRYLLVLYVNDLVFGGIGGFAFCGCLLCLLFAVCLVVVGFPGFGLVVTDLVILLVV